MIKCQSRPSTGKKNTALPRRALSRQNTHQDTRGKVSKIKRWSARIGCGYNRVYGEMMNGI